MTLNFDAQGLDLLLCDSHYAPANDLQPARIFYKCEKDIVNDKNQYLGTIKFHIVLNAKDLDVEQEMFLKS